MILLSSEVKAKELNMVNVLLTGIVMGYMSPEIISKLIKEAKIDNCYMIINDRECIDKFNKIGICYLREDAAKGKLENNSSDIVPADDELLRFMEPFFSEILNQQRRYEEYHKFQIPLTYESHYEIMMDNILFWYNMLIKNEITHLFLSSVPHEAYDSIIYHLCEFLGIRKGMVYNCTLPKRFYYLEDYYLPDNRTRVVYEKLQKKYEDTVIDNIIFEEEVEKLYSKWSSLNPNKMIPYYMKGNPLRNRFRTRFGETNILHAWYDILGNHYQKYNYHMSIDFLSYEIKHLNQYLKAIPKTWKLYVNGRNVWNRTIKLNRYYDKLSVNPDLSQKYIYFALHYQPEASSNPLGGREYSDQRIAINILASSLPEGYYLYVKSHPEQLAPLRSNKYYDDILKYKNVKLVSMKTNTYDLIKNSIAVASLTGTACWEAQFYGISAILFGYSQKNLAPLSYHVRTLRDCKNAISKIILEPRKDVSKKLKLLIKAMYDTSFSVEDTENEVPILIKNFVAKEK